MERWNAYSYLIFPEIKALWLRLRTFLEAEIVTFNPLRLSLDSRLSDFSWFRHPALVGFSTNCFA